MSDALYNETDVFHPSENQQHVSFEHYITEQHFIDQNDLHRAQQVSSESKTRLVDVLIRLGIMTDIQCQTALAAYHQLETLNEGHLEHLDPDILMDGPLPHKFCQENALLPLWESTTNIAIALTDPTDHFKIRAARLAVDKELDLYVATLSQIEKNLVRQEQDPEKITDTNTPNLNTEDLDRLKELASEAPVIRQVNGILDSAVEQKATDIHLESERQALRIRYRLDGELHVVDHIQSHHAAAVLSRIKLLAHMNIAENRLPQDGRIRTTIRGRNIDLRVATLPAIHGETIVIRILDQDAVELDFAKLGFHDEDTKNIQHILNRPNGIFLVTGPTSSGKTTTLYAALSDLNHSDRKIITVEDPVEYELPGIVQTQVKPEIGLDFARVLRATLRHNPNILLIGEIRDLETAQIAIEASLTGHLVLATLHTNSASASISRLLDMGIDDYLLASTLSGVLAQRLVRRLCDTCKSEIEMDAELLKRHIPGQEHLLDGHIQNGKVKIYQASGCDDCNHSGYRGRTIIHELLDIDQNIRQHIYNRHDASHIEKDILEHGWKSLRGDGLLKVLAGQTSLEEVLRITGQGK